MIHNLTYKSVEQVSSLGEENLRVFARLVAHQIDAVNATVAHSVRLAKPAIEAKVSTECATPENPRLSDQTRNNDPAWFSNVVLF
jgi:hypothetical protein